MNNLIIDNTEAIKELNKSLLQLLNQLNNG